MSHPRQEAIDALAEEYADDSHAPVASAEAFLEWLDGCSARTKAALRDYLVTSPRHDQERHLFASMIERGE